MQKKKLSYSEKRISPLISSIIFAVTMIAVYIACDIRLFNSMAAVDGADSKIVAAVACGVALLAAFGVYYTYLFLTSYETITCLKKLLILCSLIVVSTYVNLLTSELSCYFTPMVSAIMLAGILLDKSQAYPMVLVTAVISAIMAVNSDADMRYVNAVSCLASVCVGGFAATFTLYKRQNRYMLICTSAVGGAAAAVVFAGVQAFAYVPFMNMLLPMLIIFGGFMLFGIVAVGLMPIFERVFDVATAARLNELLNNNNPLIKRLMLEAPGTYQHSVQVANLAEAASEAVGANALLCKVGAYYHDVGKLNKPQYFKENQRDYNIHDDLEPAESARIIIAHQNDGIALLTKYKFPADVIRIAGEHHGNSHVIYFYNKALKNAASPNDVDESLYRYPGSKPTTKEGAIVMLADCCEAAVRSIKQPTIELIEAKVREVVSNIWRKRDGALSESPLTNRDVSLIENSFINILNAQYHERVEYPKLEEVNE